MVPAGTPAYAHSQSARSLSDLGGSDSDDDASLSSSSVLAMKLDG